MSGMEQEAAALEGRAPRRPLSTRAADLSRARPTRWAWERRIPIGSLSLLIGDEGVGKGTLEAWIIAQATRGMLRGDLTGPVRVLFVGDEDSFTDTVVPRLHAVSADLSRVRVLDESVEPFDVYLDARGLGDLIADEGFDFVICDNLLDTLGVGVDDWRGKEVRAALRPLRSIAREHDVAVLASMHPNKGKKESFRDLVSGSHAFNAVSRSSLLLTKHPEDTDRRVLVRGKGNLSVPPRSFEFSIKSYTFKANKHTFNVPGVSDHIEGELRVEDLLKSSAQQGPSIAETLAGEIAKLRLTEPTPRADIARAIGRQPRDGSVLTALELLEEQGAFEREEGTRGRWFPHDGASASAASSTTAPAPRPNGEEGASAPPRRAAPARSVKRRARPKKGSKP